MQPQDTLPLWNNIISVCLCKKSRPDPENSDSSAKYVGTLAWVSGAVWLRITFPHCKPKEVVLQATFPHGKPKEVILRAKVDSTVAVRKRAVERARKRAVKKSCCEMKRGAQKVTIIINRVMTSSIFLDLYESV